MNKLKKALIFSSLVISTVAFAQKQNVVLIITDDLGYGDTGYLGAKNFKTPNIDDLAVKGTNFPNGYATASTCTPTRYSVMTGEYAWRQKKSQTGILAGDDPLCVPTDVITLPKIFKKAGYNTAAIGKWHMGLGTADKKLNFNERISPCPNEIGFDYSFIIPATVDRVPSVWLRNGNTVNLDENDPIEVSYVENISDTPLGTERQDLLKQGADLQHSGSIINGISRIGYMKGGKSARFVDEQIPENVVNESIKFIKDNKENPFFLYIGIFEPHVPRTVQKRFEGASTCGIRGDVIVQADWQVGQIVKALKDANILDNTIIIFTSDNGPVVFDGYFDKATENLNSHTPAGILRGGKYNVYEGGVRVPFIIVNPNLKGGTVNNSIVGSHDFVATFAEMLDVQLPNNEAIDSISMLDIIKDPNSIQQPRDIVLQGVYGNALRSGIWKYIPKSKNQKASIGEGANPNDKRFAESVVTEDTLYNLQADPSETTNLIAKYPKIANELKAKLEEISAQTTR